MLKHQSRSCPRMHHHCQLGRPSLAGRLLQFRPSERCREHYPGNQDPACQKARRMERTQPQPGRRSGPHAKRGQGVSEAGGRGRPPERANPTPPPGRGPIPPPQVLDPVHTYGNNGKNYLSTAMYWYF